MNERMMGIGVERGYRARLVHNVCKGAALPMEEAHQRRQGYRERTGVRQHCMFDEHWAPRLLLYH